MIDRNQIYVAGEWRSSHDPAHLDVSNPANDGVIGVIPAGSARDVDDAVEAAARARSAWAATPVGDRIALLDRVAERLRADGERIADLISTEMGAPRWFSRLSQVALPLKDFDAAARAMEQIAAAAEEHIGTTVVTREPVGVVAAITPWNFPLHQIAAKVGPALLAGCTVVLKPSEVAPLNAYELLDIMIDSGLPPGVVNLISGTGDTVGGPLAAHPGVDMVSFTGSTATGRRIAQVAAPTLKKLTLELGGKSANIVLDDADLATALPVAVKQCYANTGQACAAMSRLLVPRPLLAEAAEIVVETAKNWPVGDPAADTTKLGPVASRQQQARVLGYIQSGIDDGARLLLGGASAPDGFEHGAYVPATVFTDVRPNMKIAQEEIFGPVISIMAYDTVDEAVEIANGTPYGLSGGVWSGDRDRAEQVARRLRTGQVVLNGEPLNVWAPFGGFGQSGLGLEYGRYGLEEYFNLRSLQGFAPTT